VSGKILRREQPAFLLHECHDAFSELTSIQLVRASPGDRPECRGELRLLEEGADFGCLSTGHEDPRELRIA
jgi:hypothetical protein